MKETDDLFLNALLDETYNESSSPDSLCDVHDLRFYFEKKLNEVDHLSLKDYLDQNKLKSSTLSLNLNTRCYRMKFDEHILDFPSNWSFFSEVAENEFIYIDEEVDQDMLLDIFAEMLKEEVNVLVLKDNDESVMIYLDRFDNKAHLEWARSYLEKQKNEQKKAA